jgi:hypothetical protein
MTLFSISNQDDLKKYIKEEIKEPSDLSFLFNTIEMKEPRESFISSFSISNQDDLKKFIKERIKEPSDLSFFFNTIEIKNARGVVINTIILKTNVVILDDVTRQICVNGTTFKGCFNITNASPFKIFRSYCTLFRSSGKTLQTLALFEYIKSFINSVY